MANVFLTNKTKSKPPLSGLLLQKIKNEILGEKYSLSLVLVGNSLSKNLNHKYRGKNKPTNILSFPLDKNEGEIFLSPLIIKKESAEREVKYEHFFTYLLIHGFLHLKGYDHGSAMTKKEVFFLKKFNLPEKIVN